MTPFSYPYLVKRSPRARYVRLVVTADGLVVVVPQRFCVSRDLPPLLESKKDWITKALEKVTSRARTREEGRKVPDVVDLRAVGETWRVEFAPLRQDRLLAENSTILLTSDFSENEAIASLKRWIHARGRELLPPLLKNEAERHGFSYAGVAVKEQKSLWGSCSTRGNINLNCRLLFLPPHLVKHVLLHELCHLSEMNHSSAFHDLLGRLDPGAAENALELKRARSFLPGWML
ncbi:MAG: M48 family metallopeptidase [Synergistaceae bacterium]|nr:M48 family metallopeptidase [Synergistaceae bacterium]